jgi:AcrR family transcriptional regulator
MANIVLDERYSRTLFVSNDIRSPCYARLMTTPAAPISRRARPAKVPLTRELIVRTGLTVLDRDGMDALTMRKVALELDTGAASLYVYVKNREDLLVAMLDESIADVVPQSTSKRVPWQKRLTTLIDAGVEAMSRHQGLALVSFGSVPTGPNALLIVERMIALLKEGELDDTTISWAVDLLHLHMTAVAAEQSVHNDKASVGQTEAGHVRKAGEYFESLSAEKYPMIVGLGEHLMSGSGEKRASWGLKVLLNGIIHTPAG